MDLLNQDALPLSAALEAKTLSAAELMQATLDRIDAVNGPLNAIVSLRDRETLLAEARAADEGPRKGWLHGIPMAIKDLANVAGLSNSMGSPLFAGQISAKDDRMVARLRAAGAIFVGKTNTPEFGLGSHSFNPVHGTTKNPYDTTRSAGGSSGGAAVALAARMLSLADGSDMMGSLRNPAGWNNVYGFRPSWGTVPPEPASDALSQMLATAGPMARSPRDLAALLDTQTGADAGEAGEGTPQRIADLVTPQETSLRIGWLGDWGGAYAYEPGIAEISEAALRVLGDMGHHVEALNAPHPAEDIWDSWITLRSLSAGANLAPFHADPEKRKLLKPAAQWEAERGLAFTGADLYRASAQRSAWAVKAAALFDEFDVLVLPSAQCWPFDADLVHPTEIAGRSLDTYHRWMEVVIPASLLGLPALAVPAGFGATGLPMGLQLIGRYGDDSGMLALADAYHRATLWPQRHPPALATKR